MLAYLLLFLDVIGLSVFAVLLRSSRPQMAGLAAFILWLVMALVQRFSSDLADDRTLAHLFQGQLIVELAGLCLLLGAVHALRDVSSPAREGAESRLTQIAAVIGLLLLAFNAIGHYRFPSLAGSGLSIVRAEIYLLACVGFAIRFGTKPVGLVGMGGSLLLTVQALFWAVRSWSYAIGDKVPPDVLLAARATGLLLVIAAFALASREPSLERRPYPGTHSLGMNRCRWVGIAMVLAGVLLYPLLSYLILETGVAKGLRGRAMLFAALLPAAASYVSLRGVCRLTTGRARSRVENPAADRPNLPPVPLSP